MTPGGRCPYTIGVSNRTDDFDYILPQQLIAQRPRPRGASGLLVFDRASGATSLTRFEAFADLLRPGDTLVLNDTRVIARRLHATRPSGAEAEVLLLRPAGPTAWVALVRPARSLRSGAEIQVATSRGTVTASVTGATPDGGRILQFADARIAAGLAVEGDCPLPPYIHERIEDEERYQTVYAAADGSAAAPTAGLHLTDAMLARVRNKGIRTVTITLHVGVDTFRPVRAITTDEHEMHGEWYSLTPEAAEVINDTEGRVIAIGTTSVRALESAASGEGRVSPGEAVTRLFITPGYRFQVVEGILTNFHLPKSTLLMLVSAFGGHANTMAAYRAAVEAGMLFYSFGDAMFVA